MKHENNVKSLKFNVKSLGVAALLTFAFSLSTLCAQNDTIYFMKDGVVINKQSIKPADLDSAIFYKPILADPTSGTFTDSRDNTVYKWVKIGSQVWMSENLKWLPSVVGPTTGSSSTPYYYVYSYNGTSITEAKLITNYTTYGVLYNWTAAMANAASSTANPSGVQGVCPTGWHLPSDAEWIQLTNYIGNNPGLKLKATSGWADNANENGNGTDDYLFTALPGGYWHKDGAFVSIGSYGYWWSVTEYSATLGRFCNMSSYYSDVFRGFFDKELGVSVRCVKD